MTMARRQTLEEGRGNISVGGFQANIFRWSLWAVRVTVWWKDWLILHVNSRHWRVARAGLATVCLCCRPPGEGFNASDECVGYNPVITHRVTVMCAYISPSWRWMALNKRSSDPGIMNQWRVNPLSMPCNWMPYQDHKLILSRKISNEFERISSSFITTDYW